MDTHIISMIVTHKGRLPEKPIRPNIAGRLATANVLMHTWHSYKIRYLICQTTINKSNIKQQNISRCRKTQLMKSVQAAVSKIVRCI